jgi:hypothetical protein
MNLKSIDWPTVAAAVVVMFVLGYVLHARTH